MTRTVVVVRPPRVSARIAEALRRSYEAQAVALEATLVLKETARHARKRKAALRRATPPWADMSEIAMIYARARAATRRTGILHTVDHVLPIQGRLVSGLHVTTNLKIITQRENSRKSNRWLP